jgi:hypothetical protein
MTLSSQVTTPENRALNQSILSVLLFLSYHLARVLVWRLK